MFSGCKICWQSLGMLLLPLLLLFYTLASQQVGNPPKIVIAAPLGGRVAGSYSREGLGGSDAGTVAGTLFLTPGRMAEQPPARSWGG